MMSVITPSLIIIIIIINRWQVGSWRRSVPHVDIGYGRGRGDYDSLPAAESSSSIIADAENNEFDALFKD